MLLTLWPKLAASQRGQNLAGRTPLGTYSLTNRHRAWTLREAGCAPTAHSRTRGKTLGSETYCLSPGLTAGGLCERTWNMERVAVTGRAEDRVLFEGWASALPLQSSPKLHSFLFI